MKKSIFFLAAILLASFSFAQCVSAFSKVTTENGEMFLSGKTQVCDGSYKSVVADNGTTYYVTSAAYEMVPGKYKTNTQPIQKNCITIYTTWDGSTLNGPTQSCDGSVYPTITVDNGTTVYVTSAVYQAYQASISNDNNGKKEKKKRKESNTGISVGVNFDNWTKTVNAGVTLTNKKTGDNVTISVNGIGAGKYGRQTPIVFANNNLLGGNLLAGNNSIQDILYLQQLQQLQMLQYGYGTGLSIYDAGNGMRVPR